MNITLIVKFRISNFLAGQKIPNPFPRVPRRVIHYQKLSIAIIAMTFDEMLSSNKVGIAKPCHFISNKEIEHRSQISFELMIMVRKV